MSFVVQSSTATNASGSATTTVQQIVNGIAQDMLHQIAPESPVLIDYVDRIHKEILRDRNHPFLLSEPKRFVTQKGITDYWIDSASADAGTYDTGLAITDFGQIKEDTVWDRTNDRPLSRVNIVPDSAKYEFHDGSSALSVPTMFRCSPSNLNVINIYPPPNNANGYQPSPLPPLCTTVAGGSLGARTYYVRQTFVDNAGGESNASDTQKIYVPANYLLKVRAPRPLPTPLASGITLSNYKVYAATTEGSETLQSTSTSTASDWTEPTTGLVSGAAYPTTNTLEEVGGYAIEFRYYKARATMDALADVLQVPDDYKDIVIAGVNWLTALYLRLPEAASTWLQVYKAGQRQIIKDTNLTPKFGNFIQPSR